MTDVHPLLRLWRYTAPHRGRVVLGTALSVANKIFDVVPEILIGAAVDVIVRGDDSWVADVTGIDSTWSQLVALAALNAVVWLLESATEWGYQLVWRNLAQTVEHEARMDAYAHVQDLELAYFEDQSTGGLMAILNDDVNQLERFLDVGANDMIRTLDQRGPRGHRLPDRLATARAGGLPADPGDRLGLAPLPAPPGAALPRRARPGGPARRGTLANNLGGIATIKAFTAEEREAERVGRESEAYRVANSGRDPLLVGVRPADPHGDPGRLHDDPARGRARGDRRQPRRSGFFSVLVFMTQRLLWPLTTLGETFDLYQRAMASTRRILDLLAVRPRSIEGAGRLARPPCRGGALRGRALRLRRPGRRCCAASTSRCPPARRTRSSGLTGAGKSTIVKLLLRLYDADGRPGDGRRRRRARADLHRRCAARSAS